LPDEELLKHYKVSGESAYFGLLYNRYTPLIYGLCLKYLQSGDKAQDAVMQIFEETLPKICQYDIRVFRTWIYSVAKNYCLQILRKDQKEIAVDFSIFVMESDDILHLLDEKSSDEKRMQALSRCIEKLSEPQRLCIVNFFLDEMSYVDVSEKTGYSLKHVKSNIQNGKRNLKICMEKQETE
jgi:RNA polymerase sigma factor, sigma-70 family